MSGNADGPPRRDRGHGPRRRHRDPRAPDRRDQPRRQRDRLQDADAARDLRPGDVRDLVQDDGHAPVGAGHQAGHHPSLRATAITRRRSRRPGPATPARSSWTGRHDRHRPPIRPAAPSSTTRWPPSGSATSTGALRVMSSAQGPIVSVDERRLISLSSNDYLGLTHHPRLRGGRPRGGPRVRRRAAGRSGRSPGTMSMHEALEAELAEFKGTPAVLTFQSGFTANTGVIPTITGETDLIVSRRASTTPRSSTACACRRRRARSTRTPTSTPCGRSSPRRASTAATGRGEPYRLILVVTDGVFSMDGDIAPLPGIVEAAEAHRRGGHGGRRPRRRASWVATAAARSTTSGCTAGSPSRSARSSKAVGSLGGYVAGSQALREILTQRARPFLFSTSAPAGRRGGLPRGASGSCRTSPSSRSGCGRTPRGSRPS